MKIKIVVLVIVLLSSLYSQAQKELPPEKEPKHFENGTILMSSNGDLSGENYELSKSSYSPYIMGVYFDENPNSRPDPRIYIMPYKTKGLTFVKYNTENGAIYKGDPVTSSNIPGIAMKATEPGIILGIALEDATNSNGLVKIRILIQYVR